MWLSQAAPSMIVCDIYKLCQEPFFGRIVQKCKHFQCHNSSLHNFVIHRHYSKLLNRRNMVRCQINYSFIFTVATLVGQVFLSLERVAKATNGRSAGKYWILYS